MKKRHIQTDFIKFIIEKYSNDPEPQTDIEDEGEIELPEEENDELEETQAKKNAQKEEKDLEGTEDDDIIDQLLQEYQKVKKQYENSRLSNRRKR